MCRSPTRGGTAAHGLVVVPVAELLVVVIVCVVAVRLVAVVVERAWGMPATARRDEGSMIKSDTDRQESPCSRGAVVVSGRAVVPGGVDSPGVGGNSCKAQERH